MKEKIGRLVLASMWMTTFVLVLLIGSNLEERYNRKPCGTCKAIKKKELVKSTNQYNNVKKECNE